MKATERIHAFPWTVSGRNNCNSYLVDGPVRILVDPGHRDLFGHVRSGLAESGVPLESIGLVLCTHAHPDHAEAAALFAETAALAAMHEAEWEMVNACGAAFGANLETLRPDFFVREGDLTAGDVSLEVIHVPGHAPGAVAIHWPEERALFTGDLIFRGGVGRTDLPGGDSDALKASIRRLAELDVDIVLPGHGEPIVGAGAVRENFREVETVWFNYL